MTRGSLILLPNLLDEELPHARFLPAATQEIVESLQGLIAESEKSARRYLKRFLPHERFSVMPLKLLNEHSTQEDIEQLLAPIMAGERWGLISDAGLPCIADPGAPLVKRAREKKVEIETMAGPCSIIMALQLSGMSGQRFMFHGYLPREIPELERELKQIEKQARETRATQIWIEAPYRSAKIAEQTIQTLQPATLFCIALSLTSPTQRVVTQKIADWRKAPLQIGKEPAVFLCHSP